MIVTVPTVMSVITIMVRPGVRVTRQHTADSGAGSCQREETVSVAPCHLPEQG